MTKRQEEMRMTMWEAMRALWPVIVILTGLFGTVSGIIYSRAEFAVGLARETQSDMDKNYVLKSDYKYDLGVIDEKLDYLIQLHIVGKEK